MSGNFTKMMTYAPFRDLLRAAKLRHGTDGFTYSPKEGVLNIFFALKNTTALAGFERANLGTKGQHGNSIPPKPIIGITEKNRIYRIKTSVINFHKNKIKQQF
jgi:hypothetical protein